MWCVIGISVAKSLLIRVQWVLRMKLPSYRLYIEKYIHHLNAHTLIEAIQPNYENSFGSPGVNQHT
jgi:hypothetical protein